MVHLVNTSEKQSRDVAGSRSSQIEVGEREEPDEDLSTDGLLSGKLRLPSDSKEASSSCWAPSKYKLRLHHWGRSGRPAHLCVVSVPPHVRESAHLAGPEHCSGIDLFVLRCDERERQVHMLQGT